MKVLLSVPTYNGQVHYSLVDTVTAASKKGYLEGFQVVQSSILTKCFNMLLARALNDRARGITHMLLLHADIAPEPGWLDKMASISMLRNADILSVVSPLKNSAGLTSTGIQMPGEKAVRRFTLKQLETMPKTFTHPNIRVNTGVMLIDLRKSWVEKIRFRFEDELLKNEKGQWEAENAPEDWLFSKDALDLGATVYATQEVELVHFGNANYSSRGNWGQEYDEKNGRAELT